MKSFKCFAILALLALISVFSGCNNAVQDTEDQMGFTVHFPESKSRVAYYQQSDATDYIAQILETGTTIVGKPGQTVRLVAKSEGTYTIKVTSYRYSTIIAEGQAKATITAEDFTVNVKVTLIPKQKEFDLEVEVEWGSVPSDDESHPYKILPAGTDGTAGREATYVTFGEFPQSKKDDSVTINENLIKVSGDFEYFKGSDGFWYYADGDDYFKVEPIKWRLLTTDYDHDGNPSTPGKKLLLAESALIDCDYYSYNIIRKIHGETIYANNYVRAYLNGSKYWIKPAENVDMYVDGGYFKVGFLQTAFTEEEQNLILTTEVKNDLRSLYADDATKIKESVFASDYTTSDKIFLLSRQEITRKEYGFSSKYNSACIRFPSDFAAFRGVVISYREDKQGTFWWLRSPVPKEDENQVNQYLVFVDSPGGFSTIGISHLGVVPALCID